MALSCSYSRTGEGIPGNLGYVHAVEVEWSKTPNEPEVSHGSLSRIIFSLAPLSQLPVGARIRLTVVKWKNSLIGKRLLHIVI